MQKWEYQVVITDDHLQLETVNGELAYTPGKGLFRAASDVKALWDYLNQLGEDGWEVVGVEGKQRGGEISRNQELILFLKRPKA